MKLSENKLDNLENKMVEGQTILENKVLKMSETFNEDLDCPFFHADLICDIYESTGICWKQNKTVEKSCISFVMPSTSSLKVSLIFNTLFSRIV